MKTKEELNALKAEVEALREKLCELTGDELEQVAGGYEPSDWDVEYHIHDEHGPWLP